MFVHFVVTYLIVYSYFLAKKNNFLEFLSTTVKTQSNKAQGGKKKTMDPFVEVQQDAEHQLNNLKQFLGKLTTITTGSEQDFNNNLHELEETIQDLKESIESSKENPEFFKLSESDIKSREKIVSELDANLGQLEAEWSNKTGKAAEQDNGEQGLDSMGNNPFQRMDEVEEYTQMQQQEIMREQDQHLDGVYNTMQNINQQARAIGNELEDQAFIIDELDGEFDRVSSRLGRGMKRLEFIYEKNKERANDCCIGILIVVLIVLLLLVIIV